MKDIMTPGVINDRVRFWNEWHTNSCTKLTSLEAELHVKLQDLEAAGKYTPEISEVAQVMWKIAHEAEGQLHAIGWSAEDYQDLQTSKTFRFIMRIRDLLKK